MAYILKREEAIPAIESVIQRQDNELLQNLYIDSRLANILGQAEIFKMWHGFIPVSSLPDVALRQLLMACRLDYREYCERVDYSYLIDEYANTIDNQNTRYLTQNSIKNFAAKAEKEFFTDLQLMTREEAELLVDRFLADSSPSTLQRAVTKVSAFCDWCIEGDRFPGAVNNFKKMKITYEPWVQRSMVRDAYDLEKSFRQAGLVYQDGRPAPMLLALAWMGFNRAEVLDIQNEEVNLFEKTVRGRPIPQPFIEIFLSYNGGSYELLLGHNAFEMIQEDLGYWVKRQVRTPNGNRFDDAALANVVFDTQFSYENIWLSGMMYRMYEYERDSSESITDDQIASIFQTSTPGTCARYRLIYATYKKCFWENA